MIGIHRHAVTAFAITALLLVVACPPATAQDPTRMSLDSLLAIPVHTASRYAQARSNAPAAVTVITRQEITAFGYRTLAQVLARAAGFYTSYDRNYTYVGVRGFSRPTDYNNRVLLLLNGQVMNENVYGAAPLGDELSFDLSLLDRIEIVRGPVSSLYGTSAMFAVINLITIEPVPNGGGVSAEAGSFGAVTAGGRAEFADGTRSLLLGAQLGREDGQDHFYSEYAASPTGGLARNLDWTRFGNAFGAVRWGGLRIQARVSERRKAFPTGAWETAFGFPGAETTDGWRQLGLNYERSVTARMQVTVTAAADHYLYRGGYPGEDGSVLTDATDMKRVGGGGQAMWDITPANRLVAGVSATRTVRADYRVTSPPEYVESLNLPYTSVGLYLQSEAHLRPWLTLILGLRADDETRTNAHLTPRASVIVRPRDGSTFKLLYGTAFRAPSVYERVFTNDPDQPFNALDPERIRTLEAVAEQRFGGTGMLRVSVFDDVVSDLMDPVTDAAGNYQFANVGNVRTHGIEGEATVSLGTWLINGGGIVQSASDRATGDDLSNAPAIVVRVGVNGRLMTDLEAAVQARAESSRLTVMGARTAAFGLLDLALTYDAGDRLALAGFLDNALNQDYAHPGGLEHVQDRIAQDGRRWRVQLRFRP